MLNTFQEPIRMLRYSLQFSVQDDINNQTRDSISAESMDLNDDRGQQLNQFNLSAKLWQQQLLNTIESIQQKEQVAQQLGLLNQSFYQNEQNQLISFRKKIQTQTKERGNFFLPLYHYFSKKQALMRSGLFIQSSQQSKILKAFEEIKRREDNIQLLQNENLNKINLKIIENEKKMHEQLITQRKKRNQNIRLDKNKAFLEETIINFPQETKKVAIDKIFQFRQDAHSPYISWSQVNYKQISSVPFEAKLSLKNCQFSIYFLANLSYQNCIIKGIPNIQYLIPLQYFTRKGFQKNIRLDELEPIQLSPSNLDQAYKSLEYILKIKQQKQNNRIFQIRHIQNQFIWLGCEINLQIIYNGSLNEKSFAVKIKNKLENEINEWVHIQNIVVCIEKSVTEGIKNIITFRTIHPSEVKKII